MDSRVVLPVCPSCKEDWIALRLQEHGVDVWRCQNCHYDRTTEVQNQNNKG
jgi:transposase-like protein